MKTTTKKVQGGTSCPVLASGEAVLLSIKIRLASNGVKSKSLTAELLAKHGMTPGSVQVVKAKFLSEQRKDLYNTEARVRAKFWRLVMPWGRSTGLCPIENLEDVMEQLQDEKRRFDTLVQEFVDNYDCHLELARIAHGDDFDESCYPTPAAFKAACSFDISVAPVPSSEGFSPALRKIYGKATDRTLEQKVQAGIKQKCYELLAPVFQSLADAHKVFQARKLENATEGLDDLADVLTNGAKEAVMQASAYLGSLDAEQLRKDPAYRSGVADNIKQLMEFDPFNL